MFDLFRSREKAVRYLLGGLLTLVAVSMVVTLIPGFGTNSGSTDPDVLAEIAGKKISATEASQQFERIATGNQLPPDMKSVYFPQFIDSMIEQRAAVYEAERQGFTVSEDELLRGLMLTYSQFFTNGKLTSREQFEQFLAQNGQTVEQALADVKSQMLLTKLQDSTLEAIFVSPKEIEDAFRQKYDRAKIQYIALTAGKFRDQVKPTDQELRAYFEANHNNYQQPAKYTYQVLVVDQQSIEKTIAVTDAQLRAAYSASMDNFRMPERVRARHILVKTEGKSDAEKKTLEAKAQDLLKQVKGGADFAEVAKKNSEDPGSAEKGGDLGFFVRGQMVPEFERVAFSLKPNEISGIVTTQFGYHIIQLVSKEAAQVKPFEEVKDGLIADIRKQSLTQKVQALGDQARSELLRTPEAGAEIAKKLGIEAVTMTKALPSDQIPGLGMSPEVSSLLQALKPKDVSQVLQLPGDRLVVVVMQDVTPGRAAFYDEVANSVRDSLVGLKADGLTQERAKEVAERIKKGEDINAVARSLKLEVVTSTDFGRNDSVEGLGLASYVSAAFTSPTGTVLGPLPIQGKQIIAKVVSQTAADMAALPAERETLLNAIKGKKAIERNQLLMDSILTKLTNEGKVKVHRDVIQKIMASFRTN